MNQSSSDQTLQRYLDSLLQTEPVAPRRTSVAPVAFAEPPPPLPMVLPLPAPAPIAATATATSLKRADRTVSIDVERPPTTQSIAEDKAPASSIAVADRSVPASAVDAIPVKLPDQSARPLAGRALAGRGAADWVDGRPLWAQTPFESLLFVVGGLNLAVPLVELGTIHTLVAAGISPIFGQAAWFMGMLPGVNGGSIRVVDTAQVVMPERYRPAMRGDYRYVITLNGTDWGLAVDRVASALTLSPDQVRWRGARAQRPWLAGTVVEHMCALLDPGELAHTFQQQDRRRRTLAGGVPEAR